MEINIKVHIETGSGMIKTGGTEIRYVSCPLGSRSAGYILTP